MKTHLKKLLRAVISGSSLTIAAVLFGTTVQSSRAVSADPSAGSSYTWDLLSSGSGQRGIAFITFSNDLTFHGYQLLASTPPGTNTVSSDGRGGTETRGSGLGSSSSTTNSFLFGFTPIQGLWALNPKKQIVGFFSVALNVTGVGTNYHAGTIQETLTNAFTFETTNFFVTFADGQAEIVTNITWANPPPGYTTNYTLLNTNVTVGVTSAQSTNAISFTGTAVAGKRLTLVCSTSFGKATFKGVPLKVMPDLTGAWLGSTHVNSEQFYEFFNLVSFAVDNPFAPDLPNIANFPNLYFTTNGVGPGYGFDGVAMVSSQKKIGFVLSQGSSPSNSVLRATIGNFTVNKKGLSGKTQGILEPANQIKFDINLQP